MFTASLFTTAKTRKQPKWPSTEKWIKMIWYMYTTEHSSAIEENEMMPFAATWMDLETIILSEICQKEEQILSGITICRI